MMTEAGYLTNARRHTLTALRIAPEVTSVLKDAGQR
jgi:hypothetical protein